MARYIDADGCFEDYILHRALFGNDIDYIDYVKKYPTEDVAPVVHAYWKYNEKYKWHSCSNCAAVNEEKHIKACLFCYHCGARMDAEEGSDK